MSSNINKIAILIATYNGEKYIKQQLDSLLKQTYHEWKAYIHDDGSIDRTVEIIEQYVQKYPSRFIIIEGPSTGGACSNFMYLFRNVEADYYMCCDQDDYWLPDKIRQTFAVMKKIQGEGSKPCLVHTDLKVADAELEIISESMDRYQKLHSCDSAIGHLVVQNTVTGCTMMVNRKLRDMLLLPIDNRHLIMHDWWAGMIAAQFGKIKYLDIATILYRQHENNCVGAKELNFRMMLIKLKRAEREAIRNALHNTRVQAMEFAKVYGLKEDSLVYQYGHCGRMTKLRRWKLYINKHIRKSSVFRTVGLFFWG